MSQASQLAQWNSLVRRVRDLVPDMTRRTGTDLRGLRYVLSKRFADGAVSELVTAEAFAAVLEAARRTTGLDYRDSDIITGAALYSGQTVEAEDNGYNHFVAVLPAYLSALLGQSVHYATPTASLARHSFQDVESLCASLGLRTWLLPGTEVSREDPWSPTDSDVVYGCYKKLAFEYLGEHLAAGDRRFATSKRQLAIVDQVDSILIDQANLPLVISAPKPPNADLRRKMADAAAELRRGEHYEISQDTGLVTLSGEGLARGATLSRMGAMEGLQAALLRRYLEDALRAKDWYRRVKDYQVAGARIVVSKGSRLEGAPRLRDGMLQAVEAKEGLAVSPEEVVWARITVADYFRTYPKLSGISGVAAHSGLEMQRIYGVATAVVPVQEQPARIDHPELTFEKTESRFEALTEDAARRYRGGQPVVIGTVSAADSMLVGRMLAARKVPYRALLPGEEDAAFEIMMQAGTPGSITVLTTEVARGYDISLRGPAAAGTSESQSGLAVLAAGRGRSWRSDQWLRGLAGRRGEPGEFQSFLSLADPLLRGLQSRLWSAAPEWIRQRADATPISTIQAHIIERIQKDAEEADAMRRGDLLAIDAVEGTQRSQVYSLIEEIVHKGDLAAFVKTLVDDVASIYLRRYRDPDRLLSELSMLYPTRLTVNDLTALGGDFDAARRERISGDAYIAYSRHEEFVGPTCMRETERRIVFSVLNRTWSQHLSELEAMRVAANLGSGSLDRLAEYQSEATKNYAAMLEKVKEDIVGYLFHSQPVAQ